MKQAAEIQGVLIVDKPAGITSHDVVDRVRRLFQTRRVGHTGTLDPDATGVLVLCLGQATRLADYLTSSAKHYATEIVFGLRTDTMDASGNVISECDASHVTEHDILALLPNFRGKIQQTPPMVSARRYQGKRLYELAREGITVERDAREVEITELSLTGFQSGHQPSAMLEVTCSTGTYIRVLADDLGLAVGTGAIMKTLRRTWVGATPATAFSLDDALTLDDLQQKADKGKLSSALLPLTAALKAMPQYQLLPDDLGRLRQGRVVPAPEAVEQAGATTSNASLAAVLDERGDLCALVRREANLLHPVKVLSQT